MDATPRATSRSKPIRPQLHRCDVTMDIRAGIIGLGFMGRRYAETLARLQGVTVSAVADTRADIADEVAAATGASGDAQCRGTRLDARHRCRLRVHAGGRSRRGRGDGPCRAQGGPHREADRPHPRGRRTHPDRCRGRRHDRDGRPSAAFRAALGGGEAADRVRRHRRRREHRHEAGGQRPRPGRAPWSHVDPALLRRPRPGHRSLVRGRDAALDPGGPPWRGPARDRPRCRRPVLRDPQVRWRHPGDGRARLARGGRRVRCAHVGHHGRGNDRLAAHRTGSDRTRVLRRRHERAAARWRWTSASGRRCTADLPGR